MTIEEAHEIALDIMKEIHEFCIDNDIKYSLAYGSLIGAIRHKGFIPWDDDIDIWMTRSNFEKFSRSFVSKKGYRLSSIYDSDSLINFNRVCETKKTYVRSGLKSCNGSTGIWVDIMPLDGVPDDEQLRKKQYDNFTILIGDMREYRALKSSIEQGSIKQRIKALVHFFRKDKSGWQFFVNKKANRIHSEMIRISKQYAFEQSSFCCYFQCGDAYRKGIQELLPSQSFKNYSLVKFENIELMVTEDYDNLLTLIYGNYMKLPPIEARHKSHGVCFWK